MVFAAQQRMPEETVSRTLKWRAQHHAIAQPEPPGKAGSRRLMVDVYAFGNAHEAATIADEISNRSYADDDRKRFQGKPSEHRHCWHCGAMDDLGQSQEPHRGHVPNRGIA